MYNRYGLQLDCVMNERDLGVIIDSKLLWSIHCEMILQKATKQFNLLRRTCYFIYDSRQKRALYPTLVRNILKHCCQVWSPQNSTYLDLFGKLQKRAVKWIMKKQHESYSDSVYLQKQKEFDILSVKYRLLFSDLLLFFKIVNKD